MPASAVVACTHINRAVANGPVGPAMAGPIIEPVILIFLIFKKKENYLIFFPTGPIIEPVILIFAISP